MPQRVGYSAAICAGDSLQNTAECASSLGERASGESRIVGALPSWYEWFRAAANLKNAAIDCRTRSKPPRRHPSVQAERKPGRCLRTHHRVTADAGAFSRHLPLRQQHGVLPGAGGEKATKDRGGEVEGAARDPRYRTEGIASRIEARRQT